MTEQSELKKDWVPLFERQVKNSDREAVIIVLDMISRGVVVGSSDEELDANTICAQKAGAEFLREPAKITTFQREVFRNIVQKSALGVNAPHSPK